MHEFTCKCIACGKRFEMTKAMELDAARDGVAMSPCCNFPSTVERVKVTTRTSKGEQT
jgi:hypothetical protein